MDYSKLFDSKTLEKLKSVREKWEKETLKDKAGEETYYTESGIPIDILYTPEQLADLDYMSEIGFPGQPPFVRGVYPNMYRGRLFTLRQLSGFGGPEDCNERIKFLLDKGATGINIVFDLPTIRGYDSDDRRAEGNVGICGVAIDSLADMESLFDEIPLDELTSSVVTHLPSTTVVLLAMYTVMAEKRKIPLEKLGGTTQNDFLMETTIGSAPEIIPPDKSFKLQCDAIEYAAKNLPRWNPVSYNGYNLREAGTTAVQEVAIALANCIATTEELVKRGNNVDDFARRMSFFWDLCNDFFEEIAKCRASRLVYQEIMRERFKAQNTKSQLMRFHVQTAGNTLTAVEPLNNIARSAVQGLAAILGGCQSLHVDSYDEAYSAPTEEAALVSLRTQQILQVETNVVNTVDPLAGSYYVESLTREMARKIRDYIKTIEDRGGLIKAAESGWLHREISDFAYHQQKQVENGERKIVGVNYFVSEKKQESKIDVFRYPETEASQKDKLAKLKMERNRENHEKSLAVLREKCSSEENIMPYVKDAVEAYATLGEIQEVFREEFGLWQFPLV